MTAKCFVKITNEDIYKKLEDMEKTIEYNTSTLRWHTKAIYAGSTIIMGIVSWLVAITMIIKGG